MRVVDITSYPITVTLRHPIKMSHITITESHNVVVKVTTDEGIVGWGEGVTAARLTGETQARIMGSLTHLERLIVGEDPMDRAALWLRMTSSMHDNRTAIGAIDIALHDIVGKALGVPVHELIGGAVRSSVPALTMIGSGDPEVDAKDTAEKYAAGYRWFKIKLGLTDPVTELDTIDAVGSAVGSDAVLCADANEAWEEAEAKRFLGHLGASRLRFLEQPIREGDPGGLIRIAGQSPVAICADQSIHSLADIIRYADTAVGGVSLKLVKLGGITGLMRGAHLCEAHRMHINLAGKIAETSIAAAANVHAGAAMHEIAWGASPANQGLEADVTASPLRLVEGAFPVPTGPGLGVDVDEDLLARVGEPMNDRVAGAIAGTIGVFAMVGVITTLRRTLLTDEQLAGSQTHPEKIVQRGADLIRFGTLDGRTRRRLGDAIHFGYGAAWGAALAYATEGRNVSAIKHGLPLAAGLWTFGFNVLMPALRAHPGPWTWGSREFVLTVPTHAAYGVTTATVLKLLRDQAG